MPIVEPTALFVRGIGEHTDVVEKEMYTFEDRLYGESLTLRPEATAGIVRAAIEHNLCYERPQRVWLAGPMFRHERPQKGRYRQFHQFDVVLTLAFTALAASAFAQSKIELGSEGDDLRTVISKQVGQRVELRLSSGDKIAGKVEKVTVNAVHLSSITGQELFDAAVAISHVSAVLVRTK